MALKGSGKFVAGGGYGDDIIKLKNGAEGFGFIAKEKQRWIATIWPDQNFAGNFKTYPVSEVEYIRLARKLGGYQQYTAEQFIGMR